MHDSHAHLTIEPLNENTQTIVERFKKSGGDYILNVSFTPESCIEVVKQHHELNGKFPNTVKLGLGLHPEYFSQLSNDSFDIYEKSRKAVDMIEETIENNRDILTAIGETGLDYYHIFRDSSILPKHRDEIIEAQKLSFRKHLEIALRLNRPLSLHTRDLRDQDMCIKDTLKIISEVGKGKLRGSFHSYTSSEEYIDQILDLGFYIGVNGIVTYPSAKNVRDMVEKIPNDRILIETDCPLLPPQSVREDKEAEIRYGQPSDVKEILEFVAKLKGISFEKMHEITDRNFSELFLSN